MKDRPEIQQIHKTISIDAKPAIIWRALTTPILMQQWMAEPEMKLEIQTDWTVGGPIVMQGAHHLPFENKGTILTYTPYRELRYNYLSSISHLPDQSESYTTIGFHLTPNESNTLASQTMVHLTLENFPTEAILKHVDFYWNAALGLLKKVAVTP